jgi:hypothetical protein
VEIRFGTFFGRGVEGELGDAEDFAIDVFDALLPLSVRLIRHLIHKEKVLQGTGSQ